MKVYSLIGYKVNGDIVGPWFWRFKPDAKDVLSKIADHEIAKFIFSEGETLD